jgi:hypothetical protein
MNNVSDSINGRLIYGKVTRHGKCQIFPLIFQSIFHCFCPYLQNKIMEFTLSAGRNFDNSLFSESFRQYKEIYQFINNVVKYFNVCIILRLLRLPFFALNCVSG